MVSSFIFSGSRNPRSVTKIEPSDWSTRGRYHKLPTSRVLRQNKPRSCEILKTNEFFFEGGERKIGRGKAAIIYNVTKNIIVSNDFTMDNAAAVELGKTI